MSAKLDALGKAKAMGLTKITAFPQKKSSLAFIAGKLPIDTWSFESTGHQVDKTDKGKGETRYEIK